MSDRGYIYIDRKIQEWQWWTNPIARGFWLYILLTVNYKDTYNRDGLLIPRGSMARSFKTMAKESGLTVGQVRHWVGMFKNTTQLTTRLTTQGYTLISVVNYDKYQVRQVDNNTPNNTAYDTPTTHQQHSKKERKERKESKRESKERKVNYTPPTLDEVITFCKSRNSNINPTRFYNYYNQRNWQVKYQYIDWQQKIIEWEATEHKPSNDNRVVEVPNYLREVYTPKKATKETLARVKELQHARDNDD